MAKTTGGDTVVARGVRVEGDFKVDGNIQIEGEVHGTITATGDLQIGPEARVQADIEAQNAVIAGDVKGNLNVKGKLDLLASSKFSGDLTTSVISIGAGSQINGTVHMGEDQSKAKGKKMSEPEVQG